MFLLATAVILSSASFAQGGPSGYYWRDFDGTVPPDAFPGGVDANNRPIYIAQVYAKNILMPAKIYFNDNTAYYEYGNKELGEKDNVMILCTEHPEKFEWISTEGKSIRNITGKHLVIGGYQEEKSATYIGRTRIGGEVVVSKVVIYTPARAEYDALYLISKGVQHHVFSFDVLTFQ